MNRRSQTQIVFHGAVVLVIGLLCGLPFALALTAGGSDELIRAWGFAHRALVLTSIWLLAMSAAFPLLVLTDRTTAVLVWSLVGSAYGFTVALVVAAVGGVRGLQPAGPLSNWVAFAGNTVGALGGLVAAVLTALGAAAALRRLSSG